MFSKGRKTSLIIDFVYREVEQETEEDVDIDIEIPPYIIKNILDNSYTWKADSSTNSRYCKIKSHLTASKILGMWIRIHRPSLSNTAPKGLTQLLVANHCYR